jgi:hypothetical protein
MSAAKIFSLVMNDCTFCLLELHGTHFQFGGTLEVGCRDKLFTLKALLESCVGFVDLVKAYNIANRALLFCLLKKYRAPPTFVAEIRKIYIQHCGAQNSRLRRR